jgi:hypothetical protein
MIRIPEHISAATPADESAVQATEADLGRPLMATIRSFYSLMNGAESDDGMVVYPVEVIAERQNTLALDSRMPFHQVVGSDGGDRVVLVAPTGEVILADTGNLRPGWGRPLAKDRLAQGLACNPRPHCDETS